MWGRAWSLGWIKLCVCLVTCQRWGSLLEIWGSQAGGSALHLGALTGALPYQSWLRLTLCVWWLGLGGGGFQRLRPEPTMREGLPPWKGKGGSRSTFWTLKSDQHSSLKV